MITALFATLAYAFINIEIVTHASGALVSRLTLATSSYGTSTSFANALIQVVSFFTKNATTQLAILLPTIIEETALLALSIAHKVTFTAHAAPSSCTLLTFFTKSILAGDALSIESKIASFTLLAFESIVALFTIDIDFVYTALTESIFDEISLNTTLI